MISYSGVNSALFMAKNLVCPTYSTTAVSPVILRAMHLDSYYADQNPHQYFNFIAPKYNEIAEPFTTYHCDMFNIDYKNHWNVTNADYDCCVTQTTTNRYYQESTINSPGEKFNITASNGLHFLNLEDSRFQWNYTCVGNCYLSAVVDQVFELNSNVYFQQSNPAFDGVCSAYSGGNSTINFSANPYRDHHRFPSQLGCAILFSATHVPEQFCVGFKGGTGGDLYHFIGKIYNNGSHLKNLGNNYYLFYDEVIDNIAFRSFYNSYLSKKTFTGNYNDCNFEMQFTPPVILSAPKWCVYDTQNASAPYEQVSDTKFSGFKFISTKTYMQWGCKNKEDTDMLVLKPVTASISPRYNPSGVCKIRPLMQSTNVAYFWSSATYSAQPNFGHAGFSLNTGVTDVVQWGNVSSIENMQYTCQPSSLTSIPSAWGNWASLTSTVGMFAYSRLKNIPSSWSGLESVQDANYMFGNCPVLSSIPEQWYGLDSVTSTNAMFLYCSSLSSIPMYWYGLSSARDCSNMFNGCKALTAIPDSFYGLNNLMSAQYMFAQCTSLKNITNALNYLISNCSRLQRLDYMFAGANLSGTNVSAFIDACESHPYLKRTTAHQACFKDTHVNNYNQLKIDFPTYFED